MKQLKIVAGSLTSLLLVMVFGMVVLFTDIQSQASATIRTPEVELLEVTDVTYNVHPPEQNISDDLKNQIDENAERLLHADDDMVDEPVVESEYYEDIEYVEPDTTYYEDTSEGYYEETSSVDWSGYSGYHPTDGLTPEGGVNFYDNGSGERMETAYSSRVLYHYRTSEWTVDSEGFYHDSEGRYVVAASYMEQGTVFETSKGEAIVLDCGCSPGVTDFYVNW